MAEASEADRDRFFREVRLLSTLKHKNIVPILDSNVLTKPPYFVMPKGKCNLSVAVKYDLKGELDRLDTFRKISKGVIYAHSQGIKHRDLKPDNILLGENGDVWISDFGLATKSDIQLLTITKTNDTGGTALYSAPEQYNESLRKVDERADVYSLGKILYFLLTGEHPYQMDDRDGRIPDGVRYVIRRACRPDPEDRFPSVINLLEDLNYVLDPRPITRSKEDEIRSIIETCEIWGEAQPSEADKISRAFVEEMQNSVFYLNMFPLVPPPVWMMAFQRNPDVFVSIIECFDGFVSGPLPFDYTDKVANSYQGIFRAIKSIQIRELIVERLVDMGHSHNRWHVRDVVQSLLPLIHDDVDLVFGIRDILLKNVRAAQWAFEDVIHQIPPAWKRVFP